MWRCHAPIWHFNIGVHLIVTHIDGELGCRIARAIRCELCIHDGGVLIAKTSPPAADFLFNIQRIRLFIAGEMKLNVAAVLLCFQLL